MKKIDQLIARELARSDRTCPIDPKTLATQVQQRRHAETARQRTRRRCAFATGVVAVLIASWAVTGGWNDNDPQGDVANLDAPTRLADANALVADLHADLLDSFREQRFQIERLQESIKAKRQKQFDQRRLETLELVSQDLSNFDVSTHFIQ